MATVSLGTLYTNPSPLPFFVCGIFHCAGEFRIAKFKDKQTSVYRYQIKHKGKWRFCMFMFSSVPISEVDIESILTTKNKEVIINFLIEELFELQQGVFNTIRVVKIKKDRRGNKIAQFMYGQRFCN